MMTKKNLAKAITLSVLLMLPYGMVQAATYTEAISGADDKYTEPQKTYDKDTNTYKYTLGDGAVLDLKTYYQGSSLINDDGIIVNSEKIVIDNTLDIKMHAGEQTGNYDPKVNSAIDVSGSDSLFDRRNGGNIEVTKSNGVIRLSGENNKLFLGNGNITLTNTNSYADAGIINMGYGDNNLAVYGTGTIKADATYGGSRYNRLSAVHMDINAANGNKIILGYQGDYSDADLEKFNDVDNLLETVKDLGKVELNITATNINETNTQEATAKGIELDRAGENSENAANNIIAAGDVKITTEAKTAGVSSYNTTSSIGVDVKSNTENITNIVALKSADIEANAIATNDANITAIGILSASNALNADTLVEIGEKSKIVVKTNANNNAQLTGIYAFGAVSYEGNVTKLGDGVVNTADIDITTNSTGGTVENVGIRADGGNITINGKTTISTTGGQDIAVVAGTEGWDEESADFKNPLGGTNNINLNYGAGSNITGDIISGYGGNITIGNAENGISTLSTRNNAGTLKLTGDALSANGGKLSINLTSGSTWTGRADDYQDADLKEEVESGFFNPKFSHEIAASGTVNVTLAEGATWDVTGQSWLTKLEGTGGIIDMRNGGADDTSHAVHIGDLEGIHTFVMDLDTEHSVSDMLFIKGNAGGEQKLWINSINGLENLKDGDSLRFATVNSAGLTFSGDYNFGSYENAKNGIMLADNGVMNNAFVIKSEKYDVNDSKNENEGYNGGTEFDEVKPGDKYVDENYADATNWLLAKDSSGDKVSDAGKTIINMSKVNYNNAIYMDRLNKRLGEARYISPEDEQGMWVRIRHDRIGKDDAFRSQNTMYEMGYDVKQDCNNGERRVGMAIDYMDGKAEYTGIAGDGDVKRYGLWLYDTWLGDKSHYTDYVLKWGHLENDFDIMARTTGEKITGDYSNNVFSASAEYGKKNDMGGGWYFEPQAQLQFARVTGADYVTSQDTKVSLDGINSLIGRAGFRLGRDLNENSTVYIKADLLHEFLGDQDITATDITGTLREEYENKGTWYDVGFGFATALGKSSYAFMDFEKSFGNDNDETYQINAGVQWTF